MIDGALPDPAQSRRFAAEVAALRGLPEAVAAALPLIAAPGGSPVEERVVALLAEAKPDRPRYANVEFYAGVVMDICGIPRDMFTPTFAVSRVVGWAANVLEQATERRITRPAARYVGPPAPQPVPV
jgi:citrate synthase